ncbi:hemolysin III family protein [Brevundimonas sp. 2R-24]|uniref:Hemolysin III family protein n=1 Tax=Peiella sedimenti TaxID=3061083 RepID=A0ABT8SLB6_9CAUL|nr:hemolysin III family protein [Caulobacteraceae bacterium XZ-24]
MRKACAYVLKRICTPDELDMIEHYPTRAERVADSWVHAIGLMLAGVGGIVLAALSATTGGPSLVLSTAVYAVCLIAMLGASTLYNRSRPCAARPILRRLDEAAIFLMIAGSYTPFTTQRFEDPAWAIGFTALVWTLGIGGAVGKIFAPRLNDAFWGVVYALFGWVAVLAIKPLTEGLSPLALTLLVAGGLIYTLGVLIFIRQALPFRRAIWHGFVVAGAGVHYAAILLGVVLVT